MSRITVFVDEGGDSGLKDGLHHHGSKYEWLVLAAYIVRTGSIEKTFSTRDHILRECRMRQASSVHYHKMKEDRRKQACDILAGHSARAAVLCSHKSNMREYVNPKLGKMPASKFYNWCTKLLLERVIDFYQNDSKIKKYELEPIDIIFSRMKTHDYEGMFSYFETSNSQHRLGKRKLNPKAWSDAIMQRRNWLVGDHEDHAGLQLADLVASAFYQGVNSSAHNFTTKQAEALKPIMIQGKNGLRRDAGVTLFPLDHQAPIPDQSQSLFKFYDYVF